VITGNSKDLLGTLEQHPVKKGCPKYGDWSKLDNVNKIFNENID